ncbi:MAG TPA: ATP-binding protein [Polyangia bacterium]|nr:ATP-binding protein [Polyangia bacterium]
MLSLRRVDAVLILSFAAVVVAFVIGTVTSQLRTVEIERAALSIQGDAAPSIRYLANARAELRRLQLLVHRALEDRATEDRTPEIESGRALLDAEIAAYRKLPLYPGEAVIWRRAESALSRLNGNVTDVLDAVSRGDVRAARGAEGRLDATSEEVARELSLGIDANTASASELAGRIGDSRRRGAAWAVELDAAGVLLAIFAASLALRISHDHARALGQLHEVAERRAGELDAFATRMAHDIRNPLTTAKLALDEIQRQAPGEDRIRRAAGRGSRAISHTTGMIEALLEFARAGARPSVGASACVADVADEIAAVMRPRAEEIGARLEVRAGSRARVGCSAGMLSSVLGNLVGNALKYVDGGSERQVVVSIDDEAGDVRVTVADTGPGLPAGVDPRALFQPYVRGPDARGRGLGLGLATVSRIVEAHHGRLGVDSTAAGSRFWFALPRARV